MLADVMNQVRAMSRDIAASINPLKREMCWHYTPARNALGIIEAGALLPSIPEDAVMLRPELFFTASPLPIIPGVYDLHSQPKEWLRFGYEDALLPAADWSTAMHLRMKLPGVPWDKELLKKIVVDWRISLKPVALEDISVIEASMDHGTSWWNIYTAGKPGMTAGQVLLTWHALSQAPDEPSLTEMQ